MNHTESERCLRWIDIPLHVTTLRKATKKHSLPLWLALLDSHCCQLCSNPSRMTLEKMHKYVLNKLSMPVVPLAEQWVCVVYAACIWNIIDVSVCSEFLCLLQCLALTLRCWTNNVNSISWNTKYFQSQHSLRRGYECTHEVSSFCHLVYSQLQHFYPTHIHT